MLFSSFEFMFAFLPLTFFIYFYLNRKRLTRLSKAFLVFSSLFFYSWWNIAYLPILLASIVFNFSVGVSLAKGKEHAIVSKKTLLFFGIFSNIALLGYFKYADFFIKNSNTLLGENMPLLHLALPLAISFFTFQQISYLVDSYQGKTKEYDFLNYANFVAFFPQLIAGPIVHHSEMMPQFAKKKNLLKNYRNIALGLFIFSVGLFKKAVIADTFATWANQGFDVAKKLNLLEAWFTSLSYTFQIYFDFSGYMDMAIGAALLFNIKLPINFNSPYKATSIQEFWRRWHITLSRFLRDYVYIPLGGNRQGHFKTYNNLMITFLVGGIWHGAGWTFVLWGVLHGIALITQKIWNRLGLTMNSLLAWFITFNFINITWVLFRAKEWDDATKVIGSMFSLDSIVLPGFLASKLSHLSQYGVTFGDWLGTVKGGFYTPIWIISAFILVLLFKSSTEQINVDRSKPTVGLAVFAALLATFALAKLMHTPYAEFIYFNF